MQKFPTRNPRRLIALVFLASLLTPVFCAAAAPPRTIVFFGDSLTAGYGLADPATEAFPALIQARLDAARLPWRIVNAGLSGETSSGGLRRIDWILRAPADVFVLALGANDGLRGINPAVTRSNLEQIIKRVRAKNPQTKIVLAGMQLPPEMGAAFARDFGAVFPAVAQAQEATLIPFLLEGVGGRADLNLADRIHPNPAGHAVIAETVWQVLRPLL
jgi:acyl-CoA thioesterase-1